MLVEQVVSIQQTIVVPVIVGDLGAVSVLNQLLHCLLSEGLKLDVEVKLNILYVFSGGEDLFEGAVLIWVDLPEVFNYL